MVFPRLSNNLDKVRIPACVQPKYDGECAVWTGNRLVNRFGRERYLPFCDRLPNIPVVGELYYRDGKRNFYEALTYLKTDSPFLKFTIFAMYQAGDLPFAEQMKFLRTAIQRDEQISVVEGMNAYSHLEVEHFCDHYLKEGYEGAVIKPLVSPVPESWIKFKPDETLDLVILGVSKKHSAIAVGTPDGKVLGHCSLIGKQEIAELVGKQKISGDSREDYLIEPTIVVEVKHLGVIQPSGHLRSPRISRLRQDKGVECLG